MCFYDSCYFTIKQIQYTFITVGIHSLRVENYFIIIPVEIALVSGTDELANPLTESEMPKSLTEFLKKSTVTLESRQGCPSNYCSNLSKYNLLGKHLGWI